MPTVYVVQDPADKNVIPAQRFGELKVLLERGRITLSPGPAVNKLKKALRTFSDEDYLLLVGDTVAIAMAGVVAASVNNGRVKFLRWDHSSQQYFPVQLNMNPERES